MDSEADRVHGPGTARAGVPIVEAPAELPKAQARRKPGPERIDARLLTDGTWRRLMRGNPMPAVNGLIDKHAWTFCVLESPHTGLKRRDVFARGADVWEAPRARLLPGPAWAASRPKAPAALELPGGAGEHLAELETLPDETHRYVTEGLPGNGPELLLEVHGKTGGTGGCRLTGSAVKRYRAVPHPARPAWPDALYFTHSAVLPAMRLLSLDERRHGATARPVVVPGTVVVVDPEPRPYGNVGLQDHNQVLKADVTRGTELTNSVPGGPV
ncbi:hypothetical protein [Streptomyces sp. NPDC048295]|uniref:hypothetical protein n=1 Tax=Streptomyces sp. NPDC048295 TaxID=3154617 RepID=UPI00341A6A33